MSKKIRHEPKLPAGLSYVVHYGARPTGHVVVRAVAGVHPPRLSTVCDQTIARAGWRKEWGDLVGDLGAGQRLCGACREWRSRHAAFVASKAAPSKAAIAVLALVGSFAPACGGAFTTAIDSGADELDAPPAPDAPDDAKRDGGRPFERPDARADAAADAPELGKDARPDVVAADAPRDVAPPPLDVTPEACATPPAFPSLCDGLPAGGVVYCIEVGFGAFTTAPTSAACRCTSEYTCACVLGAPDPCAGHGTLAGCTMTDGVPVVECSP